MELSGLFPNAPASLLPGAVKGHAAQPLQESGACG